MAKEAEGGQQRTLGVLTKPDTIEAGCHAGWLDVMRGKKFPLKLVRVVFGMGSDLRPFKTPAVC